MIYPYDLVVYFDSSINESRLKDEINANAAITIQCSDVGISGSDVVITFLASLSPGEQTELESVVIPSHDSSPSPNDTTLVEVTNQLPTPPTTSEGTPIYQPNIVPPGYYFWGSGAFDGTARGNGPQMAAEVIGAERTERLEGQFFEHVYILGGTLGVENAGAFDWISLELIAPASVPVVQPGGNCHLINVGPGSIILPSGNGTHNIDCGTLEAGERNLNLTPVPNPTGQGYWDWDPSASPSITPNPQAGAYDLYDFQITLGRQANRYPLLCPGDVTPTSSIKGKKILPHWKWSFVIYRKEAGTVKVAVRLATARLKTV